MGKVVKSRTEVTFVLVFFVTLAIIGMSAGSFMVRDLARARASAGWPTAEGVVLSRLRENSHELRYAYSFDGRSYQSTRDRVFSARFLNPSSYDLAPGDRLAVYVDPTDPSFSVLEPGGAGATFLVFAFLSGICIFIGVGGVLWTFSEGVDEGVSETELDPEQGSQEND